MVEVNEEDMHNSVGRMWDPDLRTTTFHEWTGSVDTSLS